MVDFWLLPMEETILPLGGAKVQKRIERRGIKELKIRKIAKKLLEDVKNYSL